MRVRDLWVAIAATACAHLMLVAGWPYLTFNDTGSYLAAAQLPISAHAFWFGFRPWAYPLLLKALGRDLPLVVRAQAIIAGVCWGFLAWSVARSLRPTWLAIGTRWAACLFSLAPNVSEWDRMILSESLSLALGTAFVAACICIARTRDWRWTVAACALVPLWLFTRDENLFSVIPIAVIALVASTVWKSGRWQAVAVAGACVCWALLQIATIQQAQRYQNGVYDNVLVRLLPTPSARSALAAAGMPDTEAVQALAGAFPDQRLQSAQLASFRAWVDADGHRFIMGYVLRHPLWPWRLFQADRANIFGSDHLAVYLSKQSPGVPLLNNLFFWNTHHLKSLYVAAVAVDTLVVLRLRSVPAGTALGLLALAIPNLLGAIASDPMETTRHGLPGFVMLQLGLLLSMVALVEVTGPSTAPTARPYRSG